MHMVKRGVTRAAMVGCAVFLALLGIQSQELRAYEVQPVSNGGMLQGTVKLKGEAPAPKQFELRRYPDRTFCGALSDGSGYRLLREVNVGQAGGLKDVVVVIEDISQGKPFAAVEAQVEANVCQFFPFVTIVAQQQGITTRGPAPGWPSARPSPAWPRARRWDSRTSSARLSAPRSTRRSPRTRPACAAGCRTCQARWPRRSRRGSRGPLPDDHQGAATPRPRTKCAAFTPTRPRTGRSRGEAPDRAARRRCALSARTAGPS